MASHYLPEARLDFEDNPGKSLHYRFQPVTGTRVYKTRISFQPDTALLQKVKTTFLSNDWRVDTSPDFGTEGRANPCAAIPTNVLDNSVLTP